MSERITNQEIVWYLDRIIVDRIIELLDDNDESIESKVRIMDIEIQIMNQIKESLK